MSKHITVELLVTDEQIERLEHLLPSWRKYESANGGRPFENWTIEDMFQHVMEVGCTHTIDKKIASEEWRQGLLKNETPAAGTAGESSN